MRRNHSSLDIAIYLVLVVALILWAIYIKATCEEIGCLAVIIPILGIFIISGIEFIVSIVILIKNKESRFSIKRILATIISGVITLFAVFSLSFTST